MDNTFPPPPILPEIEDELKNYLICPERLPIHQYEKNQQFWPRKPNPKELFHYEHSPLCTTLKVQRDPNSGEITEFREVSQLQTAGANARNSMSLNRAPIPPSEAVRGTADYIPFWPASFPDFVSELPLEDTVDTELLTVPPGFSRGITFDSDGFTVSSADQKSNNKPLRDLLAKNVVNLMELVEKEQDLLGSVFESSNKKTTNNDNKTLSDSITLEGRRNSPEEDEIIPETSELPLLYISKSPPAKKLTGTEWAICLDTSIPIKNFSQLIPEMAIEFPFKLDTFQELAILQLEQHNHVFVAAHTSAGKTVVAEYAIALSKKHMTRTIYTSPIKALSNQKYRDFKHRFKDVGLITGDFQINQTATCLIMTTEILRSMLYCGSDITRDLEYVIFDEVHYINDRERGHVWEQVLILLPAHVCVVLLSATVPNTVEFADWLGRTHQRKVYVISTYKRPVPLEHYLYTGTGGGSRDNRFLILTTNGLHLNGYQKALNSLQSKKEQEQKSKPGGSTTNYNNRYRPMEFSIKQEKNLWYGLIDHLKRNTLLPVVAFTFSRIKCDQISENLLSLDLTTEKEKCKIHTFFEKCIRNFNEADRNVPQILRMREILNRGIGVHHSGVLPIMKEIVEMLFQDGLIKLLFATETFAMGVNMPARTVVFNSITKHDGQQRRNLKPAEYIQMAGRAGRRGLDDKGTVIILCKQNVPKIKDLQKMMMGKPDLLQSQFRLTYGMVLSLLRVERISVEGMMLRSFLESDHQKQMIELNKQLELIEKEIDEQFTNQELNNYLKPLVKYYDAANLYLEFRNEIIENVMSSAKLTKVLTPGRVLLITHKNHLNKLALLLSINRDNAKKLIYKVLILTDSKLDEETKEDNPLWYKMIALTKDDVFNPLNTPGHLILTIQSNDILEITNKIIKIDTDLIIKDWEKRQIERFKFDPIGNTCNQGIQELYKLTMSNNKLEYLHFLNDLKVNETNLYENLLELYKLKDKLIDHLPSTHIHNFQGQFHTVFKRTFLETKQNNLKFLLSNASLSLYPDYENRIELLRNLNYVDLQNRVQLKGRVACEIGMNELLITELVLRNILTKLQPAEVAALLSALVISTRTDDEEDDFEELPADLRKSIKDMQEIHEHIGNLELSLQIGTDEFQNNLNFTLVHVVYEWASAKPFAEIMQLTNIQEGIIVRCIQQLNDIICDVRNAARIIGDPELQNKMEEASTAIKRDIVFAASLYTNN